MEIGKELCGARSENLEESVRKQCLAYFLHYHGSRLDELRIFLEHDGWELCPVKSNFTAAQLHEFKSLKTALDECNAYSTDSSNLTDNNSSFDSNGWLQKYLNEGSSPFEVGLDESIDEDILESVRVIIFHL